MDPRRQNSFPAQDEPEETVTLVSIGERRKPLPLGQPGFLRLDTVYQGDRPRDNAGSGRCLTISQMTISEIIYASVVECGTNLKYQVILNNASTLRKTQNLV
jgi:hypothetical protein